MTAPKNIEVDIRQDPRFAHRARRTLPSVEQIAQLCKNTAATDRAVHQHMTLESVRTWIEKRSAVPQDPDSAFVFFSELPSVKEIRVFLTTTRLMAVLDGRVRRNLDTTHNLNTHAFPTIVYGTDDADRHNHLAAAGILTHESRDFFSSVVEAVEEVRMRLKLQRLPRCPQNVWRIQ